MQITEHSPLNYPQISTIATGELLRFRSQLSYVLVVPREYVDVLDWKATNAKFNSDLGKAAAPFFARELEHSIALGDIGKLDMLRIGVAGGHTTFSMFNSLPDLALRRFEASDVEKDRLRVQIDPVVSAPIPHSLYCAGAVAELAAHKLRGNRSDISNASAKSGVFEIELIKYKHEEIYEFDWLVLGIGSKESGSLKAHLAAITEYSESVRRDAIGDISSRLFDRDGKELDERVSSQFVNIKFEHLEQLSEKGAPTSKRRRRIVVIAGGLRKVDAIAALLSRTPRLFNFLITDELTARLLIRKVGHGTIPFNDETE